MNIKSLSSSQEDYLEAIHHIAKAKGAARGKDISERLGVNGSSVTGALQSLAEKDLVNYARYDIVTLTPKGERVAASITHRHKVLKDFFTGVLGVDAETAEANACGMEHAVSQIVLDRLAKFIEFVRVCPRVDIRWVEEAGYFCRRPDRLEGCNRCIEECLQTARQTSNDHGTVSH